MWVARHAQITQNKKFAISLQYLKKVVNDEVDFLHVGKNKNLIQIDTINLMGMVKRFESSQNSKFAMSLQYLKIEVKDWFGFLHADKHQSFLKVYFSILGIKFSYMVDIIINIGHDQVFSNYSK